MSAPLPRGACKAFAVEDGSEECSILVFARDHNHARRLGYGSLSAGDYMETTARRVPAADHLIPEGCKGWVEDDPKVQHSAGWWLSCGFCEHRVAEDGCEECLEEGDEEKEMLAPIYMGSWTYCSEECRENEIARVEREARRVEGVKAVVLAKFPGVTITHVDYTGEGAAFDFPGGKQGVRWNIASEELLIAPIDFDAWAKYRGKPIDLAAISEQGRSAYLNLKVREGGAT